MQKKIISIKTPKLGFKGWFVKQSLVKTPLTKLALSIIPTLSKEQIIALLESLPNNNTSCLLIYTTIDSSLYNDKDIVISTLRKIDFHFIVGILGNLNTKLRDDKDVILAAIHNTIFETKEIFELAGPSVRDNKEVVLLALHRASHNETLDVFNLAGPNAKQDPDVLKALRSLTYQ